MDIAVGFDSYVTLYKNNGQRPPSFSKSDLIASNYNMLPATTSMVAVDLVRVLCCCQFLVLQIAVPLSSPSSSPNPVMFVVYQKSRKRMDTVYTF